MPALVDALGIGIVGLRLFDARRRPLQIGFGLLDGRFGSGDARALFAVVKASQNGALGDAIADIRPKIDQHAGNLEADLGCDARLDGAEAENLDRHIALNLRDLNTDGTQKQSPNTSARSREDCRYDSKQNKASEAHAFPHPQAPGEATCA